jgi:hypothetical protein
MKRTRFLLVFGSMLIGSVLSALTFKRFATTGRRKLAVLVSCAFLTTAATWAVPNVNDLTLMLVFIAARDLVQGYWTLASYGIPVSAVGPVSHMTCKYCVQGWMTGYNICLLVFV